MTEVEVRATVIRWVSQEFPGWLEVSIVDVVGREHRVIEKQPVLTRTPFGPDHAFPAEIWIGAKLKASRDAEVEVSLSYAVETVEGQSRLTLSASDVRRT